MFPTVKGLKDKLRRAVSMTLAVAMTLSMFSVAGFSGAAMAAQEPSSQANSSADASGDSQKPKLFIDFLGDTTNKFTGQSLPMTTDQSFAQSGGPWYKYGDANASGNVTPTVPGTVFWVGVGIDKMKLFELAKDGKGLTSLELGFYYNPDFVMPYVGGDATAVGSYDYKSPAAAAGYKALLEEKNLAQGGNTVNQWDRDIYRIEQAIPYRSCVTDPDTQETVTYPASFDNWEMLYVSLEKNEDVWAQPSRFSDPAQLDDGTIYYVMMLPFVLKQYDPSDRLCFRLARNASLFSMGGGEYGAGTYDEGNFRSSFGAWEKETRTPNHNLKEMFTFEGDLNIFAGENQPDDRYKADLVLGHPGVGDSAKLYPTADPAVWVDADQTAPNATMSGLSEGTEMTVEVTKGPGRTTSITVTDGSGNLLSLEPQGVTGDTEKYTFTMPAGNVRVEVKYIETITDADNYSVKLEVVDPDNKPGNQAQVAGVDDEGNTHTTNVSGTSIQVKPGDQANEEDRVEVHVDSHPDYRAEVKVKTQYNGEIPLTGPDENGDYTFTMPTANVTVTVTYEKRKTYYAELAVDKDLTGNGNSGNLARLSFMDYRFTDAGQRESVTLDGLIGGHDELKPIPEGRLVTLDIALAPGYAVADIQLWDKVSETGTKDDYVYNRSLLPLSELNPPDGSYDRTISFVMPDNNVEVYVIFAKAENHTAKLVLVDGKSAEMEGNKDGSDGSANAVLEKTDMEAAPTPKDTINVQTGNKVTVTLDPKPGYVVESIKVESTHPTHPNVPFNWDTTTGLVTFIMPGENVTVTVTFKEIPKDKYTATLIPEPKNVGAFYGPTTGWPTNPSDTPDRGNPPAISFPTKYNNEAGDRLTAWVDVEPGWYIASVRIVGKDSSNEGDGSGSGAGYPLLSQSGNGYNNGAGGVVILEMTQPGEHITVYVDLKEGPPPVEPEQKLTLRVEDPDNTGTPMADNWAEMTVAGTTTPHVTKSNNDHVLSPVTAGEPVEVTFQAAPGYYVSDVKVTPESFGITPEWTVVAGKPVVKFQQPAGSATVTVYFKEKPADMSPPLKATLYISGAQAGETAKLTNTTTTTAPNYTDVSGGSVAAWPVDIFQTEVQTGRFVTVDVYQGGSVVPWQGTDGNGQFVMPTGDTSVYVTFSDTEIVGKALTLTAYGPDGEAVGVAGSASMTVDGAAVGTAQSNEPPVPTVKTHAGEGQVVEVTATPGSGYVVDHITYTINGTVSPVELAAPAAGSRKVRFTMPASATGVEVFFRKGESRKYMANITLWPPAGSTAAQAGDARFTANNGYSISVVPGTGLVVNAHANDGYYISKIEITPANLGLGNPITGVFATQTVNFVMPAADCVVNVFFEKAWPDEAQINATLRVHGPVGVSGNHAQMFNVPQGTSTAQLTAGGAQTITALNQEVLKVKIATEPGYKLVKPITVEDSAGNPVSYKWSGSDEISFKMPNTIVTVDVYFKIGTDDTDLKATLYNDNAKGSAFIEHSGVIATDLLTGLHPGDRVNVSATSNDPTMMPVVWVVTEPSQTAITIQPLTKVGSTYTTNFVMQEEDAGVHIDYVKIPDETNREYLATLIATEVNGTGNAGKAKMEDTVGHATAEISTVNAASMSARADTIVTITATPESGYVVDSVVVDDGAVTVSQAGTNTYTYTMPDRAVTAVVTFKPWAPEDNVLTAQVIVNNGGNSGNKALLRRSTETSADGVVLLQPLAPADQVMVDLTVAPGYKVELITVRPTQGAEDNITSKMTLPANQSQTVHFFMPADDVIVYVKFVEGGAKYDISMIVVDKTTETTGDPIPTNPYNTATIHTDYSGTSNPPSKHGDPPVTVRGAVNDVVTIKAYPLPGYYAKVIAVSDDTQEIPVTNLTVEPNGTTFTFSVPNNNVKTVVEFYPNSVEQEKHKVRLYIVNPQFGDLNKTYARQKDTILNCTDAAGTPPTMEIEVPYLKEVSVGALALPGKYIQSAYAMYQGLMLPKMNEVNIPPLGTGGLTERAFDFKMQNGNVDVYVIFADTEPLPYTLGLTVKGPAGEPVGAAGSAVLTNNVSSQSTAVVHSNKTYDPVADTVMANATDTFSVRIKVNPGYEIDTVTVTPLSLYLAPTSITQDAATGDWIYTYPMPVPPSDLTVNVVLKADDTGKHKVTLYLEDGWLSEPGNENKTAADSPNYEKGTVTYSVYTLKHHGETMMVPETELVTIDVKPADGYYVHHAYAVTKKGEVLPLKEYVPTSITTLQNLGMPGKETSGSAKFVMPKEDVDVYIGFRNKDTDPPTGDYSAVLTVFDPTNSGSSSVTMDLVRPAGQTGSDSVTAVSNGVTSRAISVNQGETLTLTLNLAPGYELDTITVTGGAPNSVTVTQDSSNSNKYTFTMPAHDVGVVVTLKTVEVKYTATLHIVDHSSALGNAAAMQAEGGTTIVTTNGGKLTDLEGTEVVHTTATPQPGVVVRAVIATDSKGTHYLPVNAGQYDYTMDNENVDITVIFDNIDPNTPDMYLAIVEKAGDGTNLPNNTASISNLTNPALVHGSIWTGIYGEDPKQRLQIDVKTENNYYAIITARTENGTVLGVNQSGTTGTVQGFVDVPTDIDCNILITVTYSTTPPEGNHTLTLKIIDPTGDGGNTATVIDMVTGGTTVNLGVTGAANTAATNVANAAQLALTTNTIPNVYEVKRELTANGVTVLLPANGEFLMPLSDAQVTVTLKQGDRTPRPHDNRQDPAFGGTNGTGYIDGYLKGENLGANQARIQVPNLYDGTGTLAAYDPAVDYTYKLYIKDGSAYLPLVEHIDIDVPTYGSYIPDPANAVTAVHTDTGWEFNIRSLKGESALTELLTNGGVLYITATAPGKDESEYVEVTLPADPNKGKHKVTLRIVDNSGVEGNLAQMSDGKTTVTTDGAQITGLLGNELIRTVATPKSPARVSAVTVTDSGGTRLLDRVPENMSRYPYYMIGEDAVITVYFETSEDDELTRYIAAVSKYGAIGVPGNDAKIKNDTRNDLSKGSIWAEGHEGNNMRLTVSVAQDYYAHIKAYNKKTGETIIVTAFGAGPGVLEFDSILTMPAADVQVEVTFTKDPPANLISQLTLKAVNHDGKTGNAAQLAEQNGPRTLQVNGGVDTATDGYVSAGTKFDLTTAHDPDYYVEKVVVSVYDSTNTNVISTLTVNLDNNGKSEFTMPLGGTLVEVYFKKTETDPRTPRPYDPANSEDYNTGYVAGSDDDLSDPTQAGWIMATEIAPDPDGRRQITFLVPTLHDDEETDPSQALSNAGDVPNNAPAAVYKFYWRTATGPTSP